MAKFFLCVCLKAITQFESDTYPVSIFLLTCNYFPFITFEYSSAQLLTTRRRSGRVPCW